MGEDYLDRAGLDALPEGAKVKDRDDDSYVKLPSGRWLHFENKYGPVDEDHEDGYYGTGASSWLAEYTPVLIEDEDDKEPEDGVYASEPHTVPAPARVTPADVVRARAAFSEEFDGMDIFDVFDNLAMAGYFTDGFYLGLGLGDE